MQSMSIEINLFNIVKDIKIERSEFTQHIKLIYINSYNKNNH